MKAELSPEHPLQETPFSQREPLGGYIMACKSCKHVAYFDCSESPSFSAAYKRRWLQGSIQQDDSKNLGSSQAIQARP